MNNIILLTKIMLKNGISLNLSMKQKKTKKRKYVGVLIIFAFIPIIMQFITFTKKAVGILSSMGQEDVLISLVLLASAMVIFFFGIFYVLGIFYFSKDINLLLPLPLKPYQILLSKLFSALVFEYLTELVLLVPVIVVYGIETMQSFIFYLYAILIFLLLPIIPLVLCSIIIMIVMRFTNIAKNKERYSMFAGIISIVVAIAFNMYFQNFVKKMEVKEDLVQYIMESNDKFSQYLAKFFIGVKFAFNSLAQANNSEGLLNIVLFILITIVALVVFSIIGNALYFNGVIGVKESVSKRKIINNVEYDRVVRKKEMILTYILSEIKILYRTPAFFLNCVLMNLIWPIMIVVLSFSSRNELTSMTDGFNEIMNSEYSVWIYTVFAAIALFFSSSNGVSSTSISREGRNIYFKKYIPISYYKQIKAKMIASFIVSYIGILVFIVTISILLKLGVVSILFMVLIGMFAASITSQTGLLIDLNNPKIIWDNEQQAVKQNLNVLYNILVAVIFSGLIILVKVKIVKSNSISILAIFIILIILNLVLNLAIKKIGPKLFSSI